MMHADSQCRSPSATWTGGILGAIAVLFATTVSDLRPVNLAPRVLKQSVARSGELAFNPQFTYENAACMIVLPRCVCPGYERAILRERQSASCKLRQRGLHSRAKRDQECFPRGDDSSCRREARCEPRQRSG